MKDHFEIKYLTKCHPFRVNREQVVEAMMGEKIANFVHRVY